MAKSNKPKDKQNLDYILVNDLNHIEKHDLSDDYIVMDKFITELNSNEKYYDLKTKKYIFQKNNKIMNSNNYQQNLEMMNLNEFQKYTIEENIKTNQKEIIKDLNQSTYENTKNKSKDKDFNKYFQDELDDEDDLEEVDDFDESDLNFKEKIDDFVDIDKYYPDLENSNNYKEEEYLILKEKQLIEMEILKNKINLDLEYQRQSFLNKILESNDFNLIWRYCSTVNDYSHIKPYLSFYKIDKHGDNLLSSFIEGFKKGFISTEILLDVFKNTNANSCNKNEENPIMLLEHLLHFSHFFTRDFKDVFLTKLYETDLQHKTVKNHTTFSSILKNVTNYSDYLTSKDWDYLINSSNLNLSIDDNSKKSSILQEIIYARNYLGNEFHPKHFSSIIDKTDFNKFANKNSFISSLFKCGFVILSQIPNSEHVLKILEKSDFTINPREKPIFNLALESHILDLIDDKCWNHILKNTDLKLETVKEIKPYKSSYYSNLPTTNFLFDFYLYNRMNASGFTNEHMSYLLENTDLNQYKTLNLNKNNCSFLRLYLQNKQDKTSINKIQLSEKNLNYIIENTNLFGENREDGISTFSFLLSLPNLTKNNFISILNSIEKHENTINNDDINSFFKFLDNNKKTHSEVSPNFINKIIQRYDIVSSLQDLDNKKPISNFELLETTVNNDNIFSFINKLNQYNFPPYIVANLFKKIPIEYQKKYINDFSELKTLHLLNPMVLHDLKVCEELVKINPNNFNYIGKHVIEYLELNKENCLEKLQNLRSDNFWGYFKNKEADKLQEKIYNSVSYNLKNQINFDSFFEKQDAFLHSSSPFYNEIYQIKNKVKELQYLGLQYLSDFDNSTLKKLLEDNYLKNLEIYHKVSHLEDSNENFKTLIEHVNTKIDENMVKIQDALVLELKKETAVIQFDKINNIK